MTDATTPVLDYAQAEKSTPRMRYFWFWLNYVFGAALPGPIVGVVLIVWKLNSRPPETSGWAVMGWTLMHGLVAILWAIDRERGRADKLPPVYGFVIGIFTWVFGFLFMYALAIATGRYYVAHWP